MRLAEDLIERPAEEGARLVALSLLTEADSAAERLSSGTDGEALHDFRVALRRLRTVVRAFRPWLEVSVRRREEKRLKKIARSTNGARDAEVQLAWLSERVRPLDRRETVGLDCLRERLEARMSPGDESRAALLELYSRTSRKLGSRLETYESHLGRSDPNGTFGSVLAVLLREQLAVLKERLAAVKDPGDREDAHQARIEAKRLRYLLEPLRGDPHADVRLALRQLKNLQDVLGELNDVHVLADEVEACAADAAAQSARRLHAAARAGPLDSRAARAALGPSPRAGLLAVNRLVRSHCDALFQALEREVQSGGLDAVTAEVEAVATALEPPAGGDKEVERRYLLSGVPPAAAAAPAWDVALGLLPGERIRERVWRVRGPDGEHFYRSVRQGSGRRRTQAEEEVARDVFEALWPLTEGRRLAKSRHRLVDGEIAWEIDAFADRPMVLARVRLPAFASEVPPPPWLRPFLVREVTSDPAYRSGALASGAPAASTSAATEPVPEDFAPTASEAVESIHSAPDEQGENHPRPRLAS
jgi:CHAD domain-containing protein/CYTH domain-containing protein